MKELTIERGFQHIVCNCSDQYQFVIDKDCSLVIEYLADTELDVEIEATVLHDVKATILFLNHTDYHVQTKETYHVKKDASLTVAYCEVMLQSLNHQTTVYLEESGAKANVHSATVAADQIAYDIKIQHLAPYTEGIMENYGIVMTGSKWNVVATGQIVKGAYQSKSHQTTRILTLDEKETVKVLPILLIDENDVEASHATSLGQPDENQLYYMQSRGLSRTQAIQLLTIGYLLPIARVIEDETIAKQLQEEIEKKVQLCKI